MALHMAGCAQTGVGRMIGKWALLVIVVLGLMSITSSDVRAQELSVNGGFEQLVVDRSLEFYTTSYHLVGWTIFGTNGQLGNVDIIVNYWPPTEGHQSIDLVGNTGPGTGIQQ